MRTFMTILILCCFFGAVAKPHNIFANSSTEQLNGSGLPENWSFCNLSKLPAVWGSSQDAYSGGKSVFLKFEPTGDKSVSGKRYTYLFAGVTNGFSGEKALVVKPNCDYAYSFRIKGNMKTIDVILFSWNQDTGIKGRALKTLAVRAPVFSDWSCAAGYFKTGPDTTRMALGIRGTTGNPSEEIQVDDLVICEKPQITTIPQKDLRIAIYNPGRPEKTGQENIRETLAQNGFKVEMIDTLNPEVINHYGILILTTTRVLSPADRGNVDTGKRQIDYAGALLNYVHRGGGLILGHDCVGLRGIWNIPVFPQITSGKKLSETRVVNKAAEHPVTAGIPESFEHLYNDHVAIVPGTDAVILQCDSEDNAVTVAGKFRNGKIVAIGYPMGVGTRLSVPEKDTLLNAVRWCADSQKYDVPMILTEAELIPAFNKRLADADQSNIERINREIKQYANLPKPHFDEKIMWLYQWQLVTEKQIIKIVENCKKIGFNKIILQMVHGSKLYYKSELYPEDQVQRKEYDFDDMTAVVEREAKRHGIKFGVAITPYKGWVPKTAMAVEISAIDRQLLEAGKPLPPRRWLCPTNPENQERLLAICREILTKYDIDEIKFDYVRYSLGYERPCYCDYCLKRKAEFAVANPEIPAKDLDRNFAASVLYDLYSRVNTVCKQTHPQVITSCYTFSGDKLVFTYPFDRHYRYVSRFLTPEWPLDKVKTETERLTKAIAKVNPKCQFIPILANCDHANGKRMAVELALLSQTLDELKPPVRAFMYYNYTEYLARDRQVLSGKMHEELAEAFEKQLTGN